MGGGDPGRRLPRRRLPAAARGAALAALLLIVDVAAAGRIETPEADIDYPDSATTTAQAAAALFPARRAAAEAWLGLRARGRARILLVRGRAGLVEAVGPAIPDWAVGATRGDDRIVLRLDRMERSRGTALHVVLAHETVHHVLNALPGSRLPTWFEEGLCVLFAGASALEIDDTLESMASAGRLPSLAEIDAAFVGDAGEAAVAYRAGAEAAEHFLHRFGAAALRDLLGRLSSGMPFPRAFPEAAGVSFEEFEREWRASLKPALPFPLFFLLKDIDLTLLAVGAVLVILAWRRAMRRRAHEMSRLPP